MLQHGVLYMIPSDQAGRLRTLHTVDYPSGGAAFVIAAKRAGDADQLDEP
jgi:hypothetical protein